jgi:catechol 2,3-dioxygenase-like lactoylglutathione lyase family enzyme
MPARLAHLQINVGPENIGFYQALFAALGWQTVYDGTTPSDGAPPMLGVGASNDASLWFVGASNSSPNDYDGTGTNHIAIGAESVAEVDAAANYLREHNVEALFETPRHRPEFAESEAHTYYQVMFASPDGLLFEVVYTGPK